MCADGCIFYFEGRAGVHRKVKFHNLSGTTRICIFDKYKALQNLDHKFKRVSHYDSRITGTNTVMRKKNANGQESEM